MPEYDPASYGRDWAQVYDDFFRAQLPDEKDCIECLTTLVGRGPVLELGIGTGRIALPLARRHIQVHGIEGSPEMVTKLREKPGGKDLIVHIGDLADVAVEGEYTLIFAIFNTLFFVTNQNDQVRCFVNVARHLSSNGLFVVEAAVPPSGSGRGMQVHDLRSDRVLLQVHQRDHVTQCTFQQVVIIEQNGRIRLIPQTNRYIWPSELDLMAKLAGFRLRERWGDWRRGPFTSSSVKHISVYESGRAESPSTRD
jgi:SAM-dependent methyltransferase